ncbi:MAG: DUF3078 domain-containing protein [Chlorobi bacterium]|nr:DUF3078 domain-containing protein [Chlorobiota bacterium]
MKHYVVLFLMLFGLQVIPAQEKNEAGPWSKGGHFGFLFSQSAFSNWVQGGENALSALLKLDYNVSYKKDKHDWLTKFIASYGMARINNTDKKTDDQFEINSLYGRKLNDTWNFTFFGNFKTQFTPGYDYTAQPPMKISNAFAPAFLSLGPGFSYKKTDNFYVNYAPVTSKFVIVTDPDLNALGAFGVEPGKSLRYEFGSNLQMYFKTALMKNVELENMLNLFSNYLDKPQNVDVDNMMTLRMKINKYLSTTLTVRSIYDDNTLPRLQLSEVFGLEFGFDL